MKLSHWLLAASLMVSGQVMAADKPTINFSWSTNAGPLNPHQTSPNQMYAQAMLYEPLVRYVEGGKVIPWLAKSWDISDDGKTYTFQLREDVKFSNGEVFNAQAVKANFEQVLKNLKKHKWLELINQMEGIEVVSDFVVKLHLKSAYYPTLQELALVRPVRFLAPASIPKEGHTGEGIKAPIGTGPWVRTESILGVKDVFERNKNYWGEKPSFERVDVQVIADANARALAFESGLVNLIYGLEGQISPDTFDRFKKEDKLTTLISEPFSTRVIAMNTQGDVTKSLAVRKAINHAIDREALTKGIFYGIEAPAYSLFSSNVPYADLGLKPYSFNLEQARKLLADDGWKAQEGSPYLSKADTTLSVELVYHGHDANQKAMAEVVQADLKKVGIEVRLAAEERSRFFKRQKGGAFDLIFNNTWGTPYDPHTYISGMRRPSHADYEAQLGLSMKAEIDEKINTVLASTDVEQRQALYRDILTTLHEQAVYLPLSYLRIPVVAKPELKNVTTGATVFDIPFDVLKPAK